MLRTCPGDLDNLKTKSHEAIVALAEPYAKLLDDLWEVLRFYSDRCYAYVSLPEDS